MTDYENITVLSGNLYFASVATALKTDTAEPGEEPVTTITLKNCKITTEGVENLHETDTFTKDETVVITEN